MSTALDRFEVPLRACTPWCEEGDGHADEHPQDRNCWSTCSTVPLSSRRHRTERYKDGKWLKPC